MKLYIPLCITIITFLLVSTATQPSIISTPTPTIKQLHTEVASPTANPIYEPTDVPDSNVGNIVQYTTSVVEDELDHHQRYNPTPWERKLLAALAQQEDSSSMESMQAVVEVVLNRLESDHYSFKGYNSIEDVIYQAGWCNGIWVEQYQGSINLTSADPSDESFKAVDLACQGEQRLVPDAFFHAEASVPSWKIANDIYLVDEIGLTRFWGIK